MQAKCLLSFSSTVNTTLLPLQELSKIDALTTLFQNEEAFRKKEPYHSKIVSFFHIKRNYRDAIPNARDRNGTIKIEYQGYNGTRYSLSPLYQEDLEKLQIKDFTPEVWIHTVKKKIVSVLKTKSNQEVAEFFIHFSYLIGSTYYYKKGYGKWIDSLKASSSSKLKERRELFKIVEEELTLDDFSKETALESCYFKARSFYDYGKNHEYFQPKKVSNLKVSSKSIEVVQEKANVVENSPIGNIDRKEKMFNAFLDQYLEKNPHRRSSISDIALQFEEELQEKQQRSHHNGS